MSFAFFLAVDDGELGDAVRVARAAVNSWKALLDIYISTGCNEAYPGNGDLFFLITVQIKLRGHFRGFYFQPRSFWFPANDIRGCPQGVKCLSGNANQMLMVYLKQE